MTLSVGELPWRILAIVRDDRTVSGLSWIKDSILTTFSPLSDSFFMTRARPRFTLAPTTTASKI
jgi:hypothetical protein